MERIGRRPEINPHAGSRLDSAGSRQRRLAHCPVERVNPAIDPFAP